MRARFRAIPEMAALLLLCLCALLSCATFEKAASIPGGWTAAKVEGLEKLAAASPSVALESLAVLIDAPSFDSMAPEFRERIEKLWRDLCAGLAARLVESRSNGDASATFSAWRSLVALAGDRSSASSAMMDTSAVELLSAMGDSGTELGLARAEKSWADGNRVRALLEVESVLEEYPLVSDRLGLLQPWKSRALEADNPGLATMFEDAGTVPIPIQAAPATVDPVILARMASGVATVRVDKGIKIEQGMGMPDRVLGSGFYVDPRGYLVTNYHVISSEVDPKYEGYSRVTVKPSGEGDLRFPARVVGWDPILDLALLKVEGVSGHSFPLLRSAELLQGATVYAIGAPAGLESTISSGIVSAQGRKLLEWGESMQIDAPVNPGNSGGPLLDSQGNLAGIVFAGMPGFESLNFAIPQRWLSRDLPALYSGGRVDHPWLGYILGDAPKGQTGLEVVYRHPSVPDSIVEGERLLSIDGRSVDKAVDLEYFLLDRRPGDLVRLQVRGVDGSERSVLRALGSRPERPLDSALEIDTRQRLFMALLGMRVSTLPAGLFEGDSFTIQYIKPGSIADEAGLSESDPFALYGLIVKKDERIAILQLHVKKRKAGFLETIIQIPVALDIPDFI